jgi:hypothetical protein
VAEGHQPSAERPKLLVTDILTGHSWEWDEITDGSIAADSTHVKVQMAKMEKVYNQAGKPSNIT